MMAAIGGIDIALWDLKGKAAGMPVYALLGGEPRPVFTYSTGGYYSRDETVGDAAREMAGFVAKGYRAVKLKTGGFGVQEELSVWLPFAKRLGKTILLMLDLNAATV